jgi:sugar phosphate isomerase/epimerase
MAHGMHVGVMAVIDDYKATSALDVDFIEVLVREGDDLSRLELLLEKEERELIVHAPERMRVDGRSWIIDLADEDPSRREAFAQRIGEVTALAGRYGIPTVVHPGGVRPHLVPDRECLLRNLAVSLSTLEGKVWIENMPRRYHSGDDLLWCNLLTRPEEFEPLLPYVDGVTLDVCHAYLSVDAGGNSAIASFFHRLKGKVRHVHLSDASYPHNEGLQLGAGDIDFASLPRMKGLPVLLEVWGGHREGMAGYKKALSAIREHEEWFHGCIP